jgi:regulatory protein
MPQSRPKQPLDAARLEALALAYAARFATSAGKLAAYLRRKLRERGWAGEGEPPVAALVARFVAAGYVDDAGYARARAGGMLRRGLGMRRVEQALDAAGIAEEDRLGARAGPVEARQAALALVRRRRFGPFGAAPPDRATREKQLAAMLRAGHSIASARRLLDAATVADAECWAAAREEDE